MDQKRLDKFDFGIIQRFARITVNRSTIDGEDKTTKYLNN